jgi:DNA-binding response OmpR family regulator
MEFNPFLRGIQRAREAFVTTKTILIADDDADLVNILATRCRLLGLNVLCAHDAFDALSLARSERPDMICLDVEMPAGNGLSVCEMLCFDESCRTIPIAILTGRNDPDTIMRCHNLCAYYVEKCPELWSRVEPLVKELLIEPPSTHAGSGNRSLVAAIDDPVH